MVLLFFVCEVRMNRVNKFSALTRAIALGWPGFANSFAIDGFDHSLRFVNDGHIDSHAPHRVLQLCTAVWDRCDRTHRPFLSTRLIENFLLV